MRIFGIDPGSERTGYGCVETDGRRHRLVVLSNYVTPDMRRQCQALGAERVFDKSGAIDELLAYCHELAANPAAAATG